MKFRPSPYLNLAELKAPPVPATPSALRSVGVVSLDLHSLHHQTGTFQGSSQSCSSLGLPSTASDGVNDEEDLGSLQISCEAQGFYLIFSE